MASTTSGALKAHIESQGLGVPVFRDQAPEGQALPYITITEAISVVPEAAFNPRTDPDKYVSELAQVELWQRWRDATTRALVENTARAPALLRALHGVSRISTPTRTYSVTVDDARRILEEAESVVRHVFTVRLRRRA